MDFRRQSKTLFLGQTILDSPYKIPCHPKAYTWVIEEVEINTESHSLRKELRVMILDIVRVCKCGIG